MMFIISRSICVAANAIISFFLWLGSIPLYVCMYIYGAFLVAQMVKNPPAVQKIWIQSLDQEDPLEKKMASHSNILAWEVPWTEEPDGQQSMGSQKS